MHIKNNDVQKMRKIFECVLVVVLVYDKEAVEYKKSIEFARQILALQGGALFCIA